MASTKETSGKHHLDFAFFPLALAFIASVRGELLGGGADVSLFKVDTLFVISLQVEASVYVIILYKLIDCNTVKTLTT